MGAESAQKEKGHKKDIARTTHHQGQHFVGNYSRLPMRGNLERKGINGGNENAHLGEIQPLRPGDVLRIGIGVKK